MVVVDVEYRYVHINLKSILQEEEAFATIKAIFRARHYLAMKMGRQDVLYILIIEELKII